MWASQSEPKSVLNSEEDVVATSETPTRRRLPNVEEVRRPEEIVHLKRVRGGALAAVTSKRKELNLLLSSYDNKTFVESGVVKLQELFERFHVHHVNLNEVLSGDEEVLERSSQYYIEINYSFDYFTENPQWAQAREEILSKLEVESAAERKPKHGVSTLNPLASEWPLQETTARIPVAKPETIRSAPHSPAPEVSSTNEILRQQNEIMKE